jgi:hypothetical protein
MYINAENIRSSLSFGDDESFICYPVQSKESGHEGTVCFITDKDGDGSLEWCKGNTAHGYGVRVSLRELFDWVESRNRASE